MTESRGLTFYETVKGCGVMSTAMIDGISIHYEVYGEGHPLILLNGALMSTVNWIPYIETFSKKYQLILIDFIGQGQSENIDEDYNQDRQIEIVKGLLDHLHIDKINMFGASYGAQVALGFAVKYQQRLKSLMIQGIIARFNPHAVAISEAWINAAMLHDADTVWELVVPLAYGTDFYNKNLDYINQRKKLFREAVSDKWFDGFIKIMRSCYELDLLDQIHEIKVPTLIIGGDQDIIVPLKYHEEVYEKIEGSRFVIVKNSAHCPYVEKPNEFKEIALGFLETQQ